eukprot:11980843-Karenia_brevis.AAC.1
MIDSKVDKALKPLSDRLDKLEKSMAGSAVRRVISAPPGQFTPAYLEVKGFADRFEEASSSGITKEQ